MRVNKVNFSYHPCLASQSWATLSVLDSPELSVEVTSRLDANE